MRRAGSDENLTGKPKVPSEKHDILFSKARYVLNQRHIKRPWFNLNPFLEKTDENIDLENFLPGESKYIQPLESLVLCESFHNEKPVDTRELSLDAFFPYLFSTEWSKGCSLRILEGQLLDEVLLGLYRLEKEGEAVRHTTHALARNRRPRSACRKLKGTRYSGDVKETLLIEFAHFGRLIKETPNKKTLDAFEYLKTLPNAGEETSDSKGNPRHLGETGMPTRCHRKGIDINRKNINTKRLIPSIASAKTNAGNLKSQMTKHVNAICFLKTLKSNIKSQPYPVLPPIQQSKRVSAFSSDRQPFNLPNSVPGPSSEFQSRRHPAIDRSSIATNRRQSFAIPQSVMQRAQLTFKYLSQTKQAKMNLDRTDNWNSSKYETGIEGKIYSIDFEDDYSSDINKAVVEENQPKEKKDDFFGEEFFLSDNKGNSKQYIKCAKVILQKKKMEVQERRKEDECRKKLEERSRNLLKIPKLPKVDMENLESYRMHNETIEMPDEVPTLEEFVKLLKNDEYYDPRYRNKVRLKSKKIAEKYFMAKKLIRCCTMYETKNYTEKSSNDANRHDSLKTICQISSKTKAMNEGKSNGRLTLLPPLRDTNRHTGNTLKVPEMRRPCSTASVNERGLEVLGVTGSVPCKDHFMNNKKQTNVGIKDHSNAPFKSPMFPKIEIVPDEDIESLETESKESLSADNMEQCFDTNKLNLRYSIERIRKRRRSKVKKKAGFIGILAKYYNMQKTENTFQKMSPDKTCNKEIVKGRSKLKAFSKKKQQVRQNDEDKEMVIGKLKKFKFLNVKRDKKLNLENIPRGDFTSTNLEKFHQNLKEALDKFVIRREIVVSDLNTFYNATTTVTFTKISCFQYEQKRRDQ